MPIYSCQLILTADSGTGDTGGLEIRPGTHELGDLPENASALRMAGPAGTVICYDGSLQHRGVGKSKGRARVVLYLSAAGPGSPVLAGTAISPELVGLRVADLISSGGGESLEEVQPAANENGAPTPGGSGRRRGREAAVAAAHRRARAPEL